MKKSIICFLAVAFFEVSSAFGQTDVIIGDFSYSLNEDNTCTLTGIVNNLQGDLTFPATVTYEGKDYRLTAVRGDNFGASDRNLVEGVTSISFPEGVESIVVVIHLSVGQSLEIVEDDVVGVVLDGGFGKADDAVEIFPSPSVL